MKTPLTFGILLFSTIVFVGCSHVPKTETANTNTRNTNTKIVTDVVNEEVPAMEEQQEIENTQEELTFEAPKKSAHYESNAPAHGSVLPGVPVNVVIDFNFDLAAPSAISITHDGTEYGIGETIVDDNLLAMRRTMQADGPNGVYTVSYKACWPDGSCHDGQFQFAIDSSVAETYEDLRNTSEVSVDMKDSAFVPKNIRIKKGTTVTWTNSDAVTHYVNTDSHPAHTYFEEQNSSVLAQGDTYSTIFDIPGAYPYHCSAHADTMTGVILVE